MSQITTVAVAGGNGGIGRFITEALIRNNYRVTVLTRSEGTSIPGAKTVIVDYHSHASLVEVLRGIDAVVSAISGAAILDGQLQLIDAAIEAGVKRFLPSEYGVDLRSLGDIESEFQILYDFELAPKNDIREKLINHQDTISWTFVNAGIFTDTTLIPELGFDLANKCVTLVGDGNALVSWSNRHDVGEYVAAVLANPDTRNKEVNFAADTKSLNEVVADIERTHNTKLRVSYQSVEEAIATVNQTTFPSKYAAFIEELKRFLSSGYSHQKINDIAGFPGLKPATVHEYIEKLQITVA
ncbi:NAD(P)-binding protein [Basidiobolus meristosporus CBS 931.73]|uniref:NAD(P)-binding protein n=1 Tax=Basidiobolus meristosporus CBS 931.73 TaxID=1314790 RepID=A0A1Y1YL25_9FUNG|nr:NAD(P)-binding protein [Basidiobolus meristosporus CBS 931.73]|eukprot:ORX98692.1 NAD(P)-binding protein [Basidiobolus meristosporus CBS 931.73]